MLPIRQQIISEFEAINFVGDPYGALKACIETDDILDTIDDWFRGCIESLFYRPNSYCLALVSLEGSNTCWFLSNLCDCVPYANSINSPIETKHIYSEFIINTAISGKIDLNNVAGTIASDCFRVYNNEADKRLASICGTSEKWRFPQRRMMILINCKSINRKLYLNIDKNQLWAQLYHKYKIIR